MVNVRRWKCGLQVEFPWRHRVNAWHNVTFCYGHRSATTPFTSNGNSSEHGDSDRQPAPPAALNTLLPCFGFSTSMLCDFDVSPPPPSIKRVHRSIHGCKRSIVLLLTAVFMAVKKWRHLSSNNHTITKGFLRWKLKSWLTYYAVC